MTSRTGRRGVAALAGALLAAQGVPGAAAQTAAPAQATAAAAIPAGPLSSALNRFAAQTGLQVLADADVTRGRRSRGAGAGLAPDRALAALLAGTGVSGRIVDGARVELAAEPIANAALVTGQVADDEIALDAITVYGEKAARDSSRTYASVGVVTEQDLRDSSPRDTAQAYNRLANVRSFPSAEGNSSIVIRGLNAEGVTAPGRAAPVVSVLIDGAPQNIEAIRRGSRGVWDVEQIEVLRGPQSTLQGRNSLGGSIVIKTKDPTFEPEVVVDGSLGTEDSKSAAFAVSGPLVKDQVALRIAGQIAREDKDIEFLDSSLDKERRDEFEQIRAKLLLTPDALPGFSALLSVSRTHDKPGWNFVTGPDFFDRRFDPGTSVSSEFRDTKVNRYGAELAYEFSPGWKLTSLTTFSESDLDISTPAGAGWQREGNRKGKDFSQDVQLNFNPGDSRLSGVVGFFAGRYTSDTADLSATTALAPYGIPNAVVQDLTTALKTTSIAAYADLRYKLHDRWTLIGGGRLLREKVGAKNDGVALDLDATLGCLFAGCPVPVYGSLNERSSVSKTVFLPKFGLAYDLTESQTIAATAAKGYRSGFSEVVAGATTLRKIAPEYMWSYELAYRSKWFDDRLQIDANAFYYDYKDQQIQSFNPAFPGQTITENGGESHAYGAEIEARWRPIDELTLFSNVGLLKTEFDKALTTAGDVSGKEFPQSPAVTLAMGAHWKHHSGFFAGADASYTDGFFSTGDLANTRSRYVKSFTLVNATLGYEMKHATIALFARNLFDKQYLTGIDSTGFSAAIGDGRVVGVRGTARF
ncbi:TonB-dependent siderophore receptor [Methylopila jiangsuensis]|uniref:TonB-dependent siderophore receptor n=1 Tax=Methylopila jiangsuensis TaxID=586230 RepID=UPI0022F2DCCC|nr:TonB-dependent receptor [Methylopila jiangsuensis]MDR6284913.1 TonB-dependent siderophore receptor [Methylopila jiangsuensis]